MKIRMKHNRQQVREVKIVGVGCRYDCDYMWEENGALDGEKILYSEREWEPVPPEHWEPVAVSISARTAQIVKESWVFHLPEGYRFREVRVFDINIDGGTAFIVERRLP